MIFTNDKKNLDMALYYIDEMIHAQKVGVDINDDYLNTFAFWGVMYSLIKDYREKALSYMMDLRERKESFSWRLANDPDLLARVRPLKSAATRSFDNEQWPMLVAFFNTLGFPLEDVYTIDTNSNVIDAGMEETYNNIDFHTELQC